MKERVSTDKVFHRHTNNPWTLGISWHAHMNAEHFQLYNHCNNISLDCTSSAHHPGMINHLQSRKGLEFSSSLCSVCKHFPKKKTKQTSKNKATAPKNETKQIQTIKTRFLFISTSRFAKLKLWCLVPQQIPDWSQKKTDLRGRNHDSAIFLTFYFGITLMWTSFTSCCRQVWQLARKHSLVLPFLDVKKQFSEWFPDKVQCVVSAHHLLRKENQI